MPINDGSANFLQKAGDTDDGVAVKRVAIVVRQADDTGEDASAAFPMPVESPAGALALEATQLLGNTSLANIDGKQTSIATNTGATALAAQRGGGAAVNTPAFIAKANPTAIVSGTSVNAIVLAASTPYIKATITAIKPAATATTTPVVNVGDIWITSAAETLAGAFRLAAGTSMALPDNCDLTNFFLAVVNANDGVSISYTV